MGSKYIGKIYDGRWQVIRFEKYGQDGHGGRFTLKNVYNEQEISVKDTTLRRIDIGETTLSKVVYHKIKNSKGYKRPDWMFGGRKKWF